MTSKHLKTQQILGLKKEPETTYFKPIQPDPKFSKPPYVSPEWAPKPKQPSVKKAIKHTKSTNFNNVDTIGTNFKRDKRDKNVKTTKTPVFVDKNFGKTINFFGNEFHLLGTFKNSN